MLANLLEKNSMKAFAFVLSLLVSLSFYLWGVTLTDNYFWIYSCKEPEEMVMCLLSLLGMKAWFTVFGFTLLSERILAWGLNLLTVLILYGCLLRKEERSKYVYYLCGALVIVGPGIAKCCTPDNFTAVLMAMVIVSFVMMLKGKRIVGFGVLSVSTALLVAARFPNIVVVPFVGVFLLTMLKGRWLVRWQYALGYVALSLVLYWGVMTLLLGETNCIGQLADSFAKESGNSNGRHSMMGLILRYCKSILLSMIALGSIMAACYGNKRFFTRRRKLGLLVCVILGTVLCYGILGHIGEKFHSWPVCVAPLVSIPLFYVAYRAYHEKKCETAWLCLFLGMIVYVPSAGSDTGFQKSLMIAGGILPMAVAQVRKSVRRMTNVKLGFAIMVVTSLLMYQDKFCSNSALSSDPKLRGVFLPEWELKANEEIKQGLKPWLRKDHTIFYGLEAHYWYFYTDSKPLYNPGFWMLQNDWEALDKAVTALGGNQNAVLVDFTHSDKDYFLKSEI